MEVDLIRGVKTLLMRALYSDNLLRILLVAILVYMLPWAGLLPVIVKGEGSNNYSLEYETGMGGGLYTGDSDYSESLELAAIFDSEEYSKPRMLTFSSYTIEGGDIIGNIAIQAGLNEDTLISVNNIRNTRLMQIGQVIRVPNQDGIYYTVKIGDSLESIAEAHNTTISHVNTANELFSDRITPNDVLFIPGARMDWVNRQEINGDLFIWPVTGRLSSGYGWRADPFGSGMREFHTGIDIAAAPGTPIRAAMPGRIAQVGYNNVFGNFVIINHHSGYRTLYAHMSTVRVRAGAQVGTGHRIGDVGSTGISTGPHLHFTVYRNGVTVNPRTLMR